MKRALLMSLVGSLTAVANAGALAADSPKELGDVQWLRDYDRAQKLAAETHKPLLILFDEVPGCATCVRYGQAVLRHPLIVEAAETAFVPVAIYNNVGGGDRVVLDRYKEPTWNNPVVRIVDANEQSLTKRLSGDYSRAALVDAMVQSLTRARRPIPAYLDLIKAELQAERGRTNTAVFSMYCFWSGEACLGSVDGIVASRTGFLHGAEVVEITYDPSKLSYEDLVAAAKAKNCASRVFARTETEAAIAKKHFDGVRVTDADVISSKKDDKYQLRHTAWRFVPMTPLQATRANTLVGHGQDPREVFSTRQAKMYARAKQSPPKVEAMFIDDIVLAFEAVSSH